MKILNVGKLEEIKTINEAISLINEPTKIILKDELYFEKVVINKSFIEIDGLNKAVIEYNDYAKKIHEDGREYVTFRTYSVLVKAPHVTLKNLTIKNSAGYGEDIGQAVALHLYNDDIKVINCKIEAYQDTIFCGPFSPDLIERYVDLLPMDERIHEGEFHQYFINSEIKGNVDFIFGGASAIFSSCKIISIPSRHDNSWIAAPDHDKENDTGFIFINCDLVKEGDVKDGTVFLARPWREYGKVTYINCKLGSHIHPEGFSIWNGTDRHKNARFYEISSKGEGAKDLSKRISWSHVEK